MLLSAVLTAGMQGIALASAAGVIENGNIKQQYMPDAIEAIPPPPNYKWLWNITYETLMSTFKTENNRVISLSYKKWVKYGSPGDGWTVILDESAPTNNQQIVHSNDSRQYVNSIQNLVNQGYVPTLISCSPVTGRYPATGECGGTLDQPANKTFEIQCDMNLTQFYQFDDRFYSQQMILSSFTEYELYKNLSTHQYFCAIWLPNPGWNKLAWFPNLSGEQLSDTRLAQESKPYWWQGHASISESDGSFTIAFLDTDVGQSLSVDGMNTYNALWDNDTLWRANGYTMTQLSTVLRDNQINLSASAVWTKYGMPAQRQWSVTGNVSSLFENATAVSSGLDALMQTHMQSTGIRQATVAASRNGTVIVQKGYTWAEPNRPLTNPDDTFLLASVSKMYCEAAIQSLYDIKLLNTTTKPWVDFNTYPWTNYTRPSNFENITIQELLDHTSGMTSSPAGDITYNMAAVSRSLGVDRPPNISECVNYLNGFPPTVPPGNYSYSNVGYLVLSAVVETVTGISYMDYINRKISPSVQVWHTDASSHVNDTLIQESWYTGPNVIYPLQTDDPNIAAVYGGDGMYKETAVGGAGLAESAINLVSFLTNHGMSFHLIDSSIISLSLSLVFAFLPL